MSIVIFVYLFMIISAICMILTNNPVYGLKFLILIFLNFGFLLIYFNIAYLGLIFIMVYVGAVTILFLFVVMMLDIKYNIINSSNYVTVGFVFTFLLALVIFNVINFNIESLNTVELANVSSFNVSTLLEPSILTRIGVIMFNYYFVNIIIVGILLLVATIGAIYLTHNSEAMPIRKQAYQHDTGSSFFYTVYNR